MSSLRRLLRCFPAKLLASGRPGCTVNAGVSVRCFATAQLKDIPFRVKLENDEEDRMDPEDLIVPYLTDDIRKEMFLKYMENQEEWSYENLSKTYGTSLIRTKAIILLMQKRHTMISTDQQRLRQLLDPDAPPAEEKSETKYYLEPSIEVPPTLSALYAKHVEDTKVPLSVLISAHNETLLNDGKEAERVKIGEAELKEAFRILNRHTLRAENYQEAKEDTEESIEECRSYGIRVEPFRESPSSYRTNSTSNYVNRRARHVKQSFEVNYYPSLENDENVRRAELHLLRRIEHETKAQLEHDLEYYEKVYAPLTPQERLTEIRSAPLPPALQYYEPPKPDKPMSRFKLAFQDLSTSAVAKSKTKQRIPDRTVIRTRSGQLRYATPLEEQARSWRVAPGALDRGLAMQIPHLHARLIQPYLDVDGDDQAAADLVRKRRERRKAQFAEAGITK